MPGSPNPAHDPAFRPSHPSQSLAPELFLDSRGVDGFTSRLSGWFLLHPIEFTPRGQYPGPAQSMLQENKTGLLCMGSPDRRSINLISDRAHPPTPTRASDAKAHHQADDRRNPPKSAAKLPSVSSAGSSRNATVSASVSPAPAPPTACEQVDSVCCRQVAAPPALAVVPGPRNH
jgi:hypothetical protein